VLGKIKGKIKGKKSKKNSNETTESMHSEDENKGLTYLKTRRQQNEAKKEEKKGSSIIRTKKSKLLLDTGKSTSVNGALGGDNEDYEDDPFNIIESSQKRASVKRPILSSSSSVSSIETVNINKNFSDEDKGEVIMMMNYGFFYFQCFSNALYLSKATK